MRVEKIIQPARPALGQGQGPMDGGIALIMLARQAGKIKTSVDTLAGKRGSLAAGGIGVHEGRLERADARCYLYFVASGVSRIILKGRWSGLSEDMEPAHAALLRVFQNIS